MARTKGSKNKPKVEGQINKLLKSKPQASTETLATLYLMSQDKKESKRDIRKAYAYMAALALAMAFTAIVLLIKR